MVVVACGTRESGLLWMEKNKKLISLPLMLDPSRKLYLQFGLKRNLSAAFDLTVFIGYAERLASGGDDRMAYDGDDYSTIGGDFVVESSGKVVYSYPSKHQYDRPDVDTILQCIRNH